MDYFVEYYKEKDTDPMVFLQRFRCTTEPIGGGTEHDEEGELVSWDAAVAAIEIAKKQLGWRPASELPPVNTEIVIWTEVHSPEFENAPVGYVPILGRLINGKWPSNIIVKRWCYPPEKEEEQ